MNKELPQKNEEESSDSLNTVKEQIKTTLSDIIKEEVGKVLKQNELAKEKTLTQNTNFEKQKVAEILNEMSSFYKNTSSVNSYKNYENSYFKNIDLIKNYASVKGA